MKYLPTVAGAILGLLFLASSLTVLLNLVHMPPPLYGTPESHFMLAFGPTGYMKAIKVIELIGAVLVAIPLTRNLGLLALGPIILNILAFHAFVKGGVGLMSPMLLVIVALALYLLWVERDAFAGLVYRRREQPAPLE